MKMSMKQDLRNLSTEIMVESRNYIYNALNDVSLVSLVYSEYVLNRSMDFAIE